MPARSLLVHFFAAALISGCVVKSTYLRDDFAPGGVAREKRIALTVSGAPATVDRAGLVYLAILRDYLSHHSEYIIIGGGPSVIGGGSTPNSATSRPPVCTQRFGRFNPDAAMHGELEALDESDGEVRLVVTASLYRCTDGELLWRAKGDGRWDAEDSSLQRVVRGYSARYGAETTPYIPAIWRMTRKLYDSLPPPELTQNEIDERIELDAQPMFRSR